MTSTATAAGPRTLAALALEPSESDRTAIRFKEGSSWRTMSYRDMASTVRELARGLMALGIERGDRVAIFSNTRPEWTFADLAILAVGAVTVPVYQTNSADEAQYVLENSGAKAIFCEDGEQLDKVDEIRDRCPELQHVLAFTDADRREHVLSLDDLRGRGDDVPDERLDERVASVEPGDLATIVYTSGTTGPPKGCMLSHGNLTSDIAMVRRRVDFGDEAVFYVFLPLAHVLTRIVQFIAIDVGAELAFWQRDPKKLVDEIQEISPTHLPSVPRVFEKIYTKASAQAEQAGGVKLKLLRWAVGVGRKVRELERDGKSPNPVLKAQHALADRLVLSKIRSLFGNRIRLALTGAAPIEPDVLTFFHAAGVWVLEGYGMTETSAVATVNTIEEHRIGTVGKALPGCEIRIGDDGEVLMKGPNIFQGYWRNEEATNEDLKDGWLHSGDLGEIDEDGYLKITGRKKDLIITSSGKNVTPSNIENAIRQTRWVSQAVVFGDRKPYLTALITLDPDEAEALAEHVGASGASLEELASNEKVREEVQKAVDDANRQFARIEQVKKFAILPRDLSQEEDELTPTLKVKRAKVYDRHRDTFEELYA
ncbi:MAG TPA: long-chain fatty acid--CoA ligase [Solirubrobacteraceae bacterium]|nr:long-chain fatty acid--CoA ligase [Solirubrobacteraceae bacterium]